METFRTVFQPEPSLWKITHKDNVMLLGSCFSQHIGRLLQNGGFHVLSNPLGTLFNPDAIGKTLSMMCRKKVFRAKDFFERNGIFYSYDLHGDFSGTDRAQVIQNVNTELARSRDFLQQAQVVFLTFGTAWVYDLKENNKTVVNCHKIPSKEFTKRKLGVNEIVSDMSVVLNRLQQLNPKLKVVFTISPVRHLADGFVENQWSKSTLNIAIHELVRRFDHCSYFPSYELVLDDLRDYRFMDKDLVHPSESAVQYVWNAFSDVYFSADTKKLLREVEGFMRDKAHRPVHPDSVEFKKFQKQMLEKETELKKRLPWL
jgi:hypothetical protein